MKSKSRFCAFISVLVLLAPILLASCSGQPLSTREKGTLAGGAIGAGTGAIVGAAVGAPGAGAAIGGVIGAGTGALIGNELQNIQYSQHQTESQLSSQQSQLARQRREIDQLRQAQEVE
jgi:osmotically inducible lipoprotein OsmB